ncbi:MAG: heme-binding protein [Planctomycetes bacterium]|nr:heme-binding protein [Planctomycetota bacterium]
MHRPLLAGLGLLVPCFAIAPGEEPRSPTHDVVVARSTLTLEGARVVLAAAVAHARAASTTGAFAVVDGAGNLVAFERVDGTFPASSRIAVGKAFTAASFGFPTAKFEASIREGRTPLIDLADTLPDFTPLKGGVSIRVDGHVVGAIGVSGAASAEQDEEIAFAGARALDPTVGTASSGH